MKIADREIGYFWANVQKSDGCWLWVGRRDPMGYGIFRPNPSGKRTTASRASMIIHNGHPSSSKIFACHKCDNPPCVNPDHLFWGTQSDNLEDARLKGRLSVPEKGWKRHLTHCKDGHEFNEKNTYVYIRAGRPMRICRPCHKRAEQLRRLKCKSQEETLRTVSNLTS